MSHSAAAVLHHYLVEHLHSIATSRTVEPAEAAWALHRAVRHETAAAYGSGGRIHLPAFIQVLREVAQFSLQQRAVFAFLPLLQERQRGLHDQAVRTALYTAGLLAADGARDIDVVASAALGGLFADIGKTALPPHLTHGAPQTQDEVDLMHQHPARSAVVLRGAVGLLPARAVRAVQSHHERLDGSGYPAGMRGARVPYEARIVGIADAFQLRTSGNGPHGALEPFEALTEMAQDEEAFDRSLLRLFVLLLGSADVAAAA